MNTKQKGEIAELAISCDLKKLGWNILFPFGENHRYDLVAEKEGRFIRLQIKYCKACDDVLKVNCRSSNNWLIIHYNESDFEIIAVYEPLSSKIYYISSKEINHSLFMIRLRPCLNNQKANVHDCSKYESLEDALSNHG